ncbi:MAG: hypothetical protein IJU02_04145, partial [Lachnospiraceae bacterium]|nr:hypothetical protein [Lachnospiraceae bacterium]
MKKRLIITGLVATMLIGGTVVMTGCSCSNKNATQNTTTNQSATTNQTSNQTNNQSATQQQAAPTVVGNYKLIEKTDDGVTLNEGQITAQNKGRTLEVKADGTATKKEADGDVDTYKYDAEKFIENNGDVKLYTFDPNTNTLRVNDGNDVYVYQKV